MSLAFKLALAAIAAFIIYAAWPSKMSDSQRMELAKTTLKQACTSKGATSTPLPPAVLESYCSCTTERALVELGAAGVKRLSTASELTAQDQALIKNVQAACLDKLRK